jgi:uncharacterized membrane protein YadS
VALAVLVSVGAVPAGAAHALATTGGVATASAMAALGLGVDLRVVRTRGRPAAVLGAASFAALVAVMAGGLALAGA